MAGKLGTNIPCQRGDVKRVSLQCSPIACDRSFEMKKISF